MRRAFANATLFVLTTSALLVSTPASAGGVGLLVKGGAHVDRVYSYTLNESTAEYDQFIENQFNTNYGTGLEFVLGDKDNKITGVFRGYYMADTPLQNPSEGDTYAIRTTTRPIGVIDAGLQFGFLGDPGQIQMTAVTFLGSGFMTEDYTQFIFGEAGIGGTVMVARHMQLVASATGGARYRRRFFPTTSVNLGVRYLFD
jgi:hypothetical protein